MDLNYVPDCTVFDFSKFSQMFLESQSVFSKLSIMSTNACKPGAHILCTSYLRKGKKKEMGSRK